MMTVQSKPLNLAVSDLRFSGDMPPEALRIVVDGRSVVVIQSDGRVTIGEGVSVDEAARVFWDAVEDYAMAAVSKSKGA